MTRNPGTDDLSISRPRSTFAIDRLNGSPRQELIQELLLVCHSRKWAERVADARPYVDGQQLLAQADRVWQELDPADWLEALHGHPRIGEDGGTSREFSAAEQSGMADADGTVRAAIAEGNRLYEARFGHVFLISAEGRSPQDIVKNLRARLQNEASLEVQTAAQEHRRITRLRLQKLLATQGSR